MREQWLNQVDRIFSRPIKVFTSGKLESLMPVHKHESSHQPNSIAPLEFVGRTLCGLAPMLELNDFRRLSFTLDDIHQGFSRFFNSEMRDQSDFGSKNQTLVDGAFLALPMIRATKTLSFGRDGLTNKNIASSFSQTRKIPPHFNNWLLFSAMIEDFSIILAKM